MDSPRPLRIGIIGTDTSHVTHFARLLNGSETQNPALQNARITDAVPSHSADIPSSATRHLSFEAELVNLHGVRLHPSLDSMAEQVDAFIIHSIDGRKHPAQLRSLLPFRKPVFVDKPFAASLDDAAAMFEQAKSALVPVFTASLYRFRSSLTHLLSQCAGRILHVQSVGPCHLEPSHPDWFWYGIHPAEALFTVLGPSWHSLTRVFSNDADILTAQWENGAVGTVIGLRSGPMPSGITIHTDHQTLIQTSPQSTAFGAPEDYEPLVEAVVRFLRTGTPPVTPNETLALFAFLDAAEKAKDGSRVLNPSSHQSQPLTPSLSSPPNHPSTHPNLTRVVACVVQRENTVMICQRPPTKHHGGLWEFPGGKCEPGESNADAVRRELQEELGVHASLVTDKPLFEHHEPGSPFLIIFLAVHFLGTPTPVEHTAIQWTSLDQLHQFPLAPSDSAFARFLVNRPPTASDKIS